MLTGEGHPLLADPCEFDPCDAAMEIVIVGLPASGKSALFNALIGAARRPEGGGRESPAVGVAKVPDTRLGALADIFQPERVVPAELTFHDLPPAREERVQRAIGGQQLGLLQRADALLLAVRAFEEASVPHLLGGVDPHRDVEAMMGELALSDLVILERRVERIQEQLKGARASERESFLREQASLERIKGELEREVPIREQSLDEAERRMLVGYQFLTAKPLLLAFNIGEETLSDALSQEAELADRYASEGVAVSVVSAKLEAELAEMDAQEREEFRQSMGASDIGVDRVLRKMQELLGMVSFFTVLSGEVKAWMVPKDTPASRAAGTIHSDMERGFIRAEVIPFEEMARCGSLAEARRQGVLRREGRDYPVQDGDVITFLFNV